MAPKIGKITRHYAASSELRKGRPHCRDEQVGLGMRERWEGRPRRPRAQQGRNDVDLEHKERTSVVTHNECNYFVSQTYTKEYILNTGGGLGLQLSSRALAHLQQGPGFHPQHWDKKLFLSHRPTSLTPTSLPTWRPHGLARLPPSLAILQF